MEIYIIIKQCVKQTTACSEFMNESLSHLGVIPIVSFSRSSLAVPNAMTKTEARNFGKFYSRLCSTVSK